MEDLINDIKHLDRACDTMAQVCFELMQTNDWVAASQLRMLEGMLDDLGERLQELREIRGVIVDMKERADGTAGC